MLRIAIIVVIISFSTGGYAISPGLVDSLKLELGKERINDSTRAHLFLNLSYYTLNNPTEALYYGKEALHFAQITNNRLREAYALGYIGVAERLLGNSLLSIEALIESAKLFRQMNMYSLEGNALSEIGSVFTRDGDNYNALRYYRQALEVFDFHNDTIMTSNTLLNIGELYRQSGKADSALRYFQEGLDLLGRLTSGNQRMLNDCRFTIIGNMGMVHLNMGLANRAREELTDALGYFRQIGDAYRSSVYHSELGKAYIMEGDTLKGLAIIGESLQMAKDHGLKEQVRDLSLYLSEIQEKNKRIGHAFQMYKQYKMYDDSLKDVETVRKLEQQQSHFELSKKEERIEILNRINLLQRRLAGIMLGGVFIFLFLASFLFFANRRIKAVNIEILRQKTLVEQRETEKALLLKELNHRVKNNLQMVSSLLSLHSRQFKGHPAADALTEGRFRVDALSLIHQKLYRDDVDTKINVKEYIEDLARNLIMSFAPDFKLKMNISPIEISVDHAIPLGLIVNELMTNSLKYGRSEKKIPRLKLNIEQVNDNIQITIADNGKGLPPDFDLANSPSFGLKLVNSLIRQLGGNIKYNSEKGTCWMVELNKIKIV